MEMDMSQTRLLRRPEVESMVRLSCSTIYRLMKKGEFPRPINVSENSVAWRESDLEEWLSGCKSTYVEASLNEALSASCEKYLEDAGDEQHHVDKRIEPADQRPAAAHYWSPSAIGHVPGWYKIAHDGKWWFWRAKDGRDWLHAPRPEQAIINTLVALPPLDSATHRIGLTFYRCGEFGWVKWVHASRQWVWCDPPDPAKVDRVMSIPLHGKPNQPEISDSSDHIADASKMVGNHSGDANEKVGIKHDQDKPRFDLIPPRAEEMLARVLTFGANKYAPGNWQHVPDAENRYIAAALRHINAQRIGEHSDPETGLPHLAHAMCCLAFVIELHEREFAEIEMLAALDAEDNGTASFKGDPQ